MRPAIKSSQSLQEPWFWLLAIAGGLIAHHLHLSWKLTANIDELTITLLFWLAAGWLIWQKRSTLRLESDWFSSGLGLLLIAWTLVRSLAAHSSNDILNQATPLVALSGLGLLASGVRGFRQYSREFLVMLLLTVPTYTLANWIEATCNISLLVAKFSTFFLWYLGFEVSRQGVDVILPSGAITIYPGCSGLTAMLLLGRLAILFAIVFSLKRHQQFLVPVVAMLLAFSLNGCRVALMAVLVAFSQPEAFHYWHGENGAQIFSMISILLFGLFCHFLLHRNRLDLSKSAE